eukprot:Clim_evm4s53 gene=Clim_evmTU4s53
MNFFRSLSSGDGAVQPPKQLTVPNDRKARQPAKKDGKSESMSLTRSGSLPHAKSGRKIGAGPGNRAPAKAQGQSRRQSAQRSSGSSGTHEMGPLWGMLPRGLRIFVLVRGMKLGILDATDLARLSRCNKYAFSLCTDISRHLSAREIAHFPPVPGMQATRPGSGRNSNAPLLPVRPPIIHIPSTSSLPSFPCTGQTLTAKGGKVRALSWLAFYRIVRRPLRGLAVHVNLQTLKIEKEVASSLRKILEFLGAVVVIEGVETEIDSDEDEDETMDGTQEEKPAEGSGSVSEANVVEGDIPILSLNQLTVADTKDTKCPDTPRTRKRKAEQYYSKQPQRHYDCVWGRALERPFGDYVDAHSSVMSEDSMPDLGDNKITVETILALYTLPVVRRVHNFQTGKDPAMTDTDVSSCAKGHRFGPLTIDDVRNWSSRSAEGRMSLPVQRMSLVTIKLFRYGTEFDIWNYGMGVNEFGHVILLNRERVVCCMANNQDGEYVLNKGMRVRTELGRFARGCGNAEKALIHLMLQRVHNSLWRIPHVAKGYINAAALPAQTADRATGADEQCSIL